MIVNTKKLEKNINLIKNRNKKNEYYLTDLVEIFSKKKFSVSHFSCKFQETLGVNSMNDLAIVNQEFQKLKEIIFK